MKKTHTIFNKGLMLRIPVILAVSRISYVNLNVPKRSWMRSAYQDDVRKVSKGFTIIELLIIIAIIGILSALIMANAVGVRQRANDGKRKSDIKQIQSALEFYRSDLGVYPNNAVTNKVDPNCPTTGTKTQLGNTGCTTIYLQKLPKDPKTSADYYYNGGGSSYTLVACLENVNDAESSTGSYGCPTGTVNYVSTNP